VEGQTSRHNTQYKRSHRPSQPKGGCNNHKSSAGAADQKVDTKQPNHQISTFSNFASRNSWKVIDFLR
jgi:hypothetical protein